jgi:hypothetical protein
MTQKLLFTQPQWLYPRSYTQKLLFKLLLLFWALLLLKIRMVIKTHARTKLINGKTYEGCGGDGSGEMVVENEKYFLH